MLQVEMGIEPNNEGSGSVRFDPFSGSGSVRVRKSLSFRDFQLTDFFDELWSH